MKARRQDKIIELIQEYDVETQEELADLLSNAGYQVTQATVSRDIRELNLTKVSVDGKGQKYVVLQGGDGGMNERYTRVLRSGFVSMDMAQNILVINGSGCCSGCFADQRNCRKHCRRRYDYVRNPHRRADQRGYETN